MSKFAAALALSAMLLASGSALACSAPATNQAPGVPGSGHCLPSAPAVMIHLPHIPSQVEVHVGDTVGFAGDRPRSGPTAIDPSMKMNIPGSLTELDPAAFYEVTLFIRGDEERLWNVFEATKPGAFYASVVFTPSPGVVPLTIPVIINVLP